MKKLALLTVVLLSACATHPEDIKPALVEEGRFMAMTCDELAAAGYRVESNLGRYVNSQKRARVGDALTWPIPVSRVFGTNRRNVQEISILLGERNAIAKAKSAKCATTVPVQPAATSIPSPETAQSAAFAQ